MNTITEQLSPLRHLLSKDPIPKKELVQKAHEFAKKRNFLKLLEMIEFFEAYIAGNEIILN